MDIWLEILSEPCEGKVTAQLVDEREKLWCLEEEMETHYSSGGGVQVNMPLSAGLEVAHLSTQSGVWQRGRVVGQVGEGVEIIYWDYPGLVRAHVSMLRSLDPKFTRLPAQLVLVQSSQLARRPHIGELVKLKKGGGKANQTKSLPQLTEEESFKRVVLAMMAREA